MVLETQEERLNSVNITEAPEGISRGSQGEYLEDKRTHNPGEMMRLRSVFVDKSYPVYLDGERIGTATPGGHLRFEAPQETGTHTIRVGDGPSTEIQFEVVPRSGSTPTGDTVGDADDWTNTEEPGPDIDPANYAGIVNADNDEGVALDPALRREGASLGPDGATVTLPDGETVDVGAIEEADEVARVLEGENAGDVIEADQPAVDGDPSSSSGGSGPDSGVIGAVGVGIVLLLAGAAALLGGT